MKNIDRWEETTVVYKNGQLITNENYVGDRSLLVSQQTVGLYEKLIKKHASGILLDLGCGTVPYYRIYKNEVDRIICIDWANSFHDNIHLDYIADLNEKIPMDDNSVNTILLMDVLEHIREPVNLMAEISRILSPGGKLILGVPFLYWLHEEPYDYHRYTKYQLEEFCKQNGLEVLSLEVSGGPLSVIGDIIAKNIPSNILAKILQKMLLWFLHTRFGKKIDDRNKHSFPRNYCLVAQKNS
jgi:SAM-dependent methyltransferase